MKDLPKGWETSSLADIAKWGSGGTPQAGNHSFYGGEIAWAVIGDLNDGVVTHTRSSITPEGLATSSAKMVPEGAILVAMYGSIGKLGIAGRPMSTNQAIAFAIPNGPVLARYLFHYLRAQRTLLDAAGKGATQRNISQTILKAWPIDYPVDLAEQQEIIYQLELNLSAADRLEEQMRVARRRTESFRQSLFSAAFSGSLVSESSTRKVATAS